jgi:Tol biopolymer transport system component
MKRILPVAIALAALVPLSAQTLEVQLQRAVQKEAATGDLKAAIETYKKIATTAGSNHAIAAQALLHEAEVYQKLGDMESRKIYERIVRDFGDQKDAVATASLRLGGLGNAAGAAGPGTRVVVSYGPEASRYAVGPSPDGRHIAFMRWIDETAEAWIVAPDGSGLRKLWQGEQGKWSDLISWFPDNRRFLMHIRLDDQKHRLIAISATDGTATELWEGAHPAGLMSPDGNYVFFSQRVSRDPVRDELRLLSLADKTETVVLSDFPAVNPAVNANWTPDSRGLVFLSDRRKPGEAHDLWYLAVANGKAQGRPELVRSDFGDHPILGPITRDGSLFYRLATAMREILSAQIDPVTGKATGTPVSILGEGAGQAGQGIYSPDGQWLAYVRQSSAGTLIPVLRKLTTGEEKNFNTNTGFIGGYEQTWFPDSQSLLVNGRHTTSEPFGLYRVSVQNGAVTLLKAGSFGAAFVVSPDGKTVYYSQRLANETQTRVMAWEIETGRERELLRGDGQGPTHWISMALSPDGKQLATARSDGAEYVLEIQPAEGGRRREVCRVRDTDKIELEWNPDGRYLIFNKATQDQTGFWRVPVTGGTPQEMGITSRAMGKISIHPDGRHIAFVANLSVSQVMALENFLPTASK